MRLAVLLFALARAQSPTGTGTVFYENDNHQIVIEGELPTVVPPWNYSSWNTSLIRPVWTPMPYAWASGGAAIVCVPGNAVPKNDSTYWNNCADSCYQNQTREIAYITPRADYAVEFPRNSTYYIWIRGMSFSSETDSFFLGLDGWMLGNENSPDKFDGMTIDTYNTPLWIKNSRFNTSSRIVIKPTVGRHTVNIWIREPGVAIDQILLIEDGNFTPNINVSATPVIIVPECVNDKAFVHAGECNTNLTNVTAQVPAPYPASLSGPGFVRCSTVDDNQFCGDFQVGWTPNLVQNGRGQFAGNTFWSVPIDSLGSFINLGGARGFNTTDRSGVVNYHTTRSQLIDLRARGLSAAFLDTWPSIRVVASVQPASGGIGIDHYRYTVELRSTANGTRIGNALFNENNKIDVAQTFDTVTSISSVNPLRYIWVQEDVWDETVPGSGPILDSISITLNLDECSVSNGGCDPRRVCVDQLTPPALCGDCAQGFVVEGATNCTQINSCLDTTLCPVNSDCFLDDNSTQGYGCACHVGYIKLGSVCLDVNECNVGNSTYNDTNGFCGSKAYCLNVVGAQSSQPVCIPYVVNCSLSYNAGISACNQTLALNTAGNLSFTLVAPGALTLSSLSFGPAIDPTRFPCGGLLVQNTTVVCSLDNGAVGAGLTLAAQWCDQTACYTVSVAAAGTFNFVRPSLNSPTLRVHPGGPLSSTLNSVTNLGELLSFQGTNFMLGRYQNTVPSYRVVMTNGLNVVACDLQSDSTETLTICRMPPGDGTGYVFQVWLDGQLLATGIDVYNYALAPVIISVSGCPTQDGNNGTSNCPTDGQINITVNALYFDNNPIITVGGKLCIPRVVSSNLVKCLLPPLTGVALPIVMASNGTVSVPRPLVSYAAPNLVNVSGCLAGSSPLQITDCDRTGMSVLTIMGTNFGADLPTVFVGQTVCSNVSMPVPHQKVVCAVPPGLARNLAIVLIQFDGSRSTVNSTLSYKQCPAGYDSGAPVCKPCAAGTFASTPGSLCIQCPGGRSSFNQSASCFTCPVGTYANNGMPQCDNCTMGRIAARSGSALCDDCPGGKYAPLPRSSYCINCELGRSQANEAQGNCSSCPMGQYADYEAFSTCQACPKGKYVARMGASICVDCDMGFHNDQTGRTRCEACEQGSEAPTTGSIVCSLCQVGHYALASSAGTVRCTMCPVGTRQPSTGASSCSACPLGTAQPLPGKDDCLACVEGYYNDGTSPSLCLGCDAGKFSPSSSAVQCVECSAGYFSANASKECGKCPFGYYSSQAASADCFPCPTGAAADITRTRCDCPVGRYGKTSATANNRTMIECFDCPRAGAECTEPGVTFETIATSLGWWRSSVDSMDYYRCVHPNLCLGGHFSTCEVHQTGPLCAVCEAGYQSSGPGKLCSECPVIGTAWTETILIFLVVIAIIAVLVYLVLKFLNLQQNKLLEAIRLQDALASEKLGTTLKEYEVGDDYFATLRKQRWKLTHEGEPPAEGEEEEEGDETEMPSSRPPNQMDSPRREGDEPTVGGAAWVTISGGSSVSNLDPFVAEDRDLNEPNKPKKNASFAEIWRAYRNAKKEAGTQAIMRHAIHQKASNINSRGTSRRAPNFIYKVKILLGFFQVAAIMPLNGEIQWPKYWATFISAFSIFNFDFVPWQSLGCAAHINYFHKAMIVGCIPLIAVMLIGIAVYFGMRMGASLGLEQQLTLQQRQEQAWRQFVKLVLFTIFLLYPFSSKMTLGVYNCIEVNGVYYLASDFTLQCSGDSFAVFAGINVIFVVLYPIGVPLACLFLIHRKLESLDDPKTILQYGFLYEAYQRDRWWWEVIDMLHKLLLTSCLLFLPDHLVLGSNILTVMIYLLLLLLLNPYIRKGDDRFHLLVQGNLYLLALMGYVLSTSLDPYNTTFASRNTMHGLLSALLIAVNLGLFLGFFIIAGRNLKKILWELVRGYEEQRKTAKQTPL